MAYRNVSESLGAYRDRLSGDLDEARRAAKDAAERAAKVTVLERELAETDGLLDELGPQRRGLPMLDNVQIAAPCKASWSDMVGDEHVRFCGQCDKNVYNLSSLPREEAEALLVARDGSMCVRMYRRQDGTVLTADCPVGVKKRRRRRAAVAAVGGGLMAVAAALGAQSAARMGGIAPPVTGELHAQPIPTPQEIYAVQGGIGPAPVDPPPAPTTPPRGWTTGARKAAPPQPKHPSIPSGDPLMGQL